MSNNDTWVIVPVYNEESVIKSTLSNLSVSFPNIVCINDGSSDSSENEIKKTNAVLINHIYNMGQGASLQTGIDYALADKGAKYFITFDADGQHRVKDAIDMKEYLKENKADIILGSRFIEKNTNNIPKKKRVLLKIATYFTSITTGLKLTDTHNGLRIFNRKTANTIVIRMNGMSHASEILSQIKYSKLTYKEFPVKIIYNDYSKSKGQSTLNLVNILFDLLINFINRSTK